MPAQHIQVRGGLVFVFCMPPKLDLGARQHELHVRGGVDGLAVSGECGPRVWGFFQWAVRLGYAIKCQ